jgi:outer membrane receptor protein involved in Fe transport
VTPRLGGVAAVALLYAASAAAQTASPPPEPAESGDVVVYGRALAQVGTATSGSQGAVGYEDFANRPLLRVGELAENVPGLIATQHSGTGKANQYFLRGFNLDHGTDLAGYVDGEPINMRTHGHGQGYLDLNFLIPELVERIDYAKGPYAADAGDFAAAGTIRFRTVDALPAPFAELTGGSFGYARALAAGSTAAAGGTLLAALDLTRSNGPWTLPEDLRKANALIKFSRGTDAAGWSVKLEGYHARWNATDQVPLRAIEDGAISRYGNIDPYLGGHTTRVGLTGEWRNGGTSATAYATYYDFGLTSNFTYYLSDPASGDEFQQADRRGVFGGSLRRAADLTVAGLPATLTVGADARYDLIGNVGLYTSRDGVRTGTVRQDRVGEESGNLWGSVETRLTPALRLTLGVNAALYGYDVRSSLAANSGSGSDALVAPKVALAWRVGRGIELYADYGEGYHSNDARGATRIDPATGLATDPVPLLVRARGGEVGARLERGRLSASLVGFTLALGSELVFAGDEGTTEPNAASRRWGTEATLFWRPVDALAIDAAAAFTHARFAGVAAGEDRIPNSVGNVVSAGATWTVVPRLALTLRLRHFGSAPLVEDGSAWSSPTTLVNGGAYLTLGRDRIGFDVLNVLNSRADDIAYYYASRLPGEPADGVDDYHVHPVEPREVRVSLRHAF